MGDAVNGPIRPGQLVFLGPGRFIATERYVGIVIGHEPIVDGDTWWIVFWNDGVFTPHMESWLREHMVL